MNFRLRLRVAGAIVVGMAERRILWNCFGCLLAGLCAASFRGDPPSWRTGISERNWLRTAAVVECALLFLCLSWFFASFHYPVVGASSPFQRAVILLACLFYLQRCVRHVRLLGSHATRA